MAYGQNARWEPKYIVQKSSGEPVDSDAEYLVLRLDDPYARIAALAWAAAIEHRAPLLAEDVRQRVTHYNMTAAQRTE